MSKFAKLFSTVAVIVAAIAVGCTQRDSVISEPEQGDGCSISASVVGSDSSTIGQSPNCVQADDYYLFATGYIDSVESDIPFWVGNPSICGTTYGGAGCFRGVPVRYRTKCQPGGSWSSYKLIPVGSFNGRSPKIFCTPGGTGLDVELGMNDSLSTSKPGTVILDTSSVGGTPTRVVRAFNLPKATWANGPRDTVWFHNWYAVPYTQLVTVASRAITSFGYTLPITPVHLNNAFSGDYLFTATYDTVYLQAGKFSGGTKQYWDFQNIQGIWHEYGHHYLYRALHNSPYNWHGEADSIYHYSELGETWAEFFGGWAGSMLQYAHVLGGLPESPPDPFFDNNSNSPDNWGMETDSLRAFAYDFVTEYRWGGLETEFYVTSFLNDLVDQVSDSNGYRDTTGSGINVDDDSASNWGAKYLADAMTSNFNGGTAKCTITWPTGGIGGVHTGPYSLQDLIMCLEHSTKVQEAVPTIFRPYWRNDAISVTETITEPAGWSASKVRQLWRKALFNSGLHYFKFNTTSGWKCMTSVGDSIKWNSAGGYSYRFGGVGGTNASNSWVPSDVDGATRHYVDDFSYGSQFEVQLPAGFTAYPGIKFDSIGAAGTWFSWIYGLTRIPFSEQDVQLLPATLSGAILPVDSLGTVQFSMGQTCP